VSAPWTADYVCTLHERPGDNPDEFYCPPENFKRVGGPLFVSDELGAARTLRHAPGGYGGQTLDEEPRCGCGLTVRECAARREARAAAPTAAELQRRIRGAEKCLTDAIMVALAQHDTLAIAMAYHGGITLALKALWGDL
jgi:hypothetical protein